MRKFLCVFELVITILFYQKARAFSCPNPVFSHPETVFINSERSLLVTHASFIYDRARAARLGIDSQIALSKKRSDTVIYLNHQLLGGPNNNKFVDSTYYTSDCDPTYRVLSGGELSFFMPSTHVISVGGFWEMCQAQTLKSLLQQWASVLDGNFILTQVMDGIYSCGCLIKYTDPYHEKFTQAARVEQAKPPFEGGTWSLSQIMDLIDNRDLEIQLLKRNLPPYQILGPAYQVDLFYENSFVETLQQSNQLNGKVKYLRIEYVRKAR